MEGFNLSVLKKELKSIGFKASVKSFSFGKVITYYHLDGAQKPSIYSVESLIKFQPLIDYLADNNEKINKLKKELN